MTNLSSRLDKLENQFGKNKTVIIYYRESHQTLEQANEQYREENGFELTSHAKIICYRRIDVERMGAQ